MGEEWRNKWRKSWGKNAGELRLSTTRSTQLYVAERAEVDKDTIAVHRSPTYLTIIFTDVKSKQFKTFKVELPGKVYYTLRDKDFDEVVAEIKKLSVAAAPAKPERDPVEISANDCLVQLRSHLSHANTDTLAELYSKFLTDQPVVVIEENGHRSVIHREGIKQ